MIEVRVLSDAVNNVVVQVAGRRYPGMVVQGDRLREWSRLADSDDPESIDMLAQELRDAVAEYERVVGPTPRPDPDPRLARHARSTARERGAVPPGPGQLSSAEWPTTRAMDTRSNGSGKRPSSTGKVTAASRLTLRGV